MPLVSRSGTPLPMMFILPSMYNTSTGHWDLREGVFSNRATIYEKIEERVREKRREERTPQPAIRIYGKALSVVGRADELKENNRSMLGICWYIVFVYFERRSSDLLCVVGNRSETRNSDCHKYSKAHGYNSKNLNQPSFVYVSLKYLCYKSVTLNWGRTVSLEHTHTLSLTLEPYCASSVPTLRVVLLAQVIVINRHLINK